MTNDRFYKQQHFSKKNTKDKSKKNTHYNSYQRGYSFGDLLSDVGNQEIARFFESLQAQPKLNISQPGDIYEQEADRVAKDIVNNKRSKKTKISRVQGRSNKKMKSVDGNLESKIKALKGKGSSLNKSLRDYYEPRFGVDLGNVKIHTGENQLNELARSMRAKAFTHGKDIVFGEGQYQPETTTGKELIAHELTHTLQQGEGVQRDIVQKKPGDYDPSTRVKSDNERLADEIISRIEVYYDIYGLESAGYEGWRLIVNLKLTEDTIFEVLKIIFNKNKDYFFALRVYVNTNLLPLSSIDFSKNCKRFTKLVEENEDRCFELMIVNSGSTTEEIQDHQARTIWEVFEKYKKNGGSKDWDELKNIVKRRDLTNNKLIDIDNINQIKENWIIVVPVEYNKNTKMDNVKTDKVNDRGNIFIEHIVDGSYVYTKNYGWLDRTHAGFTSGPNTPKKVKKAYNDILNANIGDIVEYEQWSGKAINLPLLGREEFKVNQAKIRIKILKKCSENIAKGVMLYLFKIVSLAFEKSQEMTDWIARSSFAEEDLPSNIINFYCEVMNYDENFVKKECKYFSKEESLWIYNRYKFKNNKTFNPIIKWPGGKKPVIFDIVKEIPEGEYWEIVK